MLCALSWEAGWILGLSTLAASGEGGRVSLSDWLSGSWVLDRGGASCREIAPGLAASRRGGPGLKLEREWGRVRQIRGGAYRKGQDTRERAGPRNERRSGPTGRADCSRGGATPGD